MKLLSFIFLYILVFLRVWIPLMVCLVLHEMVHQVTESILTRKKLSFPQLINPFGGLFFPFFAFAVRSAFGSSLIFGWTKPRVNKDLTVVQNIWVSLSGPLFNLSLAFLLTAVGFHLGKMDIHVENHLLLWFLEPFFILLIKLNLLIFLVNLLPFYPFDLFRLWAPAIQKKGENAIFISQGIGLVVTLLLFGLPVTWRFIDKIIQAFVSLMI